MCSSLNMYLYALLLFLSYLLLAQPTLGTDMASTANFTENVAAITNSSFFIAKSGCKLKCGDITVPYPFGFGKSRCYISSWFQLTCNTSSDPPKLFLGELEVSSISQTQVRVRNSVAVQCFNPDGTPYHTEPGGMTLGEGGTFSDTANKFTVVGCNAFAWIAWSNEDFIREFSTGCSTSRGCSRNGKVLPGKCTGFGCCQIDIPKGFRNFNATDTLYRVYDEPDIEVWILFPFRYSDRNVAQ